MNNYNFLELGACAASPDEWNGITAINHPKLKTFKNDLDKIDRKITLLIHTTLLYYTKKEMS